MADSSPPSSSPPEPPASTTGSTDFLPSNTSFNRFLNFCRAATGLMSPNGLTAYWNDRDIRDSPFDCRRCESQRDYLLRYSPVIRYMSSNIASLGGDMGAHNIRCRSCIGGKMLAGFDHSYGIILCANLLQSQNALEDVLAHEMVHAYDHLRFKTNLDRTTNLKEIACTEIRASNLSGECRWANEFFRNKFFAFTNHHQDCVRRRAVKSVMARPNCADDVQAVKVVNEVWDSCFRDTRPFDEIYR